MSDLLIPVPQYIVDHPEYGELVFSRSAYQFDSAKAGTTSWHFEIWFKGKCEYTYTDEFTFSEFMRVRRLRIPTDVQVNRLAHLFSVVTMYDRYGGAYFASVDIGQLEFLDDKSKNPPIEIHHEPKSYKSVVSDRGFTVRGLSDNRLSGKKSGRGGTSQPRPPIDSSQTSYTGHAENLNNSGVFSEEDSVIVRTTKYREWTGVRTPSFVKREKEGNLPVNPHHVLMWEEHDGYFNYFSSGNGTNEPTPSIAYSYERCHVTKYYPTPSIAEHNASADTKALQKLTRKASGIRANLAVDLGQFRQTTNLIADSARRIARALSSVKRGNNAQAARELFHPGPPAYHSSKKNRPSASKDLASNWLALQYGWKPLLNDIHEMVELSRERAPRDVVRTSAMSKVSLRNESPFTIFGSPSAHAGIQGSYGYSQCTYGLRFKVNSTLLQYLAQTGFTNPVNLAWEFLPYSFVADWFLPIGPYLETLSSWDGLDFVGGYQTRFTKCTDFCHVSFDHIIPQSYVHQIGTGAWSRNVVRLDRTPLPGFPVQNLPAFKNPLSVSHALSALALLRVGFAAGSRLRD